MSDKKKLPRQALGRGLDALIPGSDPAGLEDAGTATGKRVIEIEIDKIKRNPRQPRMQMDEAKLAELADSIKENGIIQPVIVRKTDDGYELIAGERRTRAAKQAGFDLVPAIIYNVSNEESLEFALIENIQRDDLNALELAKAYKLLMEEFDLTQEQVAGKVGKERATVANYLRLLGLNDRIKQLIAEGKISFGHARAILSVENESEQLMLAGLVAKEGLSVRECEKLAAGRIAGAGGSGKTKKKSGRNAPVAVDYNIRSLEERLQQFLGTKVKIVPKGDKNGTIEIEYYTLDELERILELFDIDPYEE